MRGYGGRWSGFARKNNMDLKAAIAVLKNGGVVVFPTETSYGIGCDATNAKAVRRVFAIKGRPEGKGTPLIVDSLKMAKRWGKFSPTAQRLAKKYWPGPLTMVVPVLVFARNDKKIVQAVLQNKTVALRVSSHPIARALAKGLGRPIVATSANRSGQPPAFSCRALSPLLTGKDGSGVVYVVNVGALPKQKPTTIVKIIGNDVEVLRQGKIKL